VELKDSNLEAYTEHSFISYYHVRFGAPLSIARSSRFPKHSRDPLAMSQTLLFFNTALFQLKDEFRAGKCRILFETNTSHLFGYLYWMPGMKPKVKAMYIRLRYVFQYCVFVAIRTELLTIATNSCSSW
jgi:hypothetical protein